MLYLNLVYTLYMVCNVCLTYIEKFKAYYYKKKKKNKNKV